MIQCFVVSLLATIIHMLNIHTPMQRLLKLLLNHGSRLKVQNQRIYICPDVVSCESETYELIKSSQVSRVHWLVKIL